MMFLLLHFFMNSFLSLPLSLSQDPPLLYDPGRATQRKQAARPVPALPTEPSALDEQMNFLLNENENLKQQNHLLMVELKRYQDQYQSDQATISHLSRVSYPLSFQPQNGREEEKKKKKGKIKRSRICK